MLEPPTRAFEVGVDECGRGCLAGPVVAGAVCWDPAFVADAGHAEELSQIRDSKRLSSKKRKALSDFIRKHARFHAVAFVHATEIDTRNILQCTYDAMHAALDCCDPEFIRVDGDRFRKYKDIQHVCCVRGDDRYLSIAAASILAKVARDEYMENHPYADLYDWKNNKGYGTAKHRDAIRAHGTVPGEHRMTFLKRILTNQDLTE
jgi:ribonuclease HII